MLYARWLYATESSIALRKKQRPRVSPPSLHNSFAPLIQTHGVVAVMRSEHEVATEIIYEQTNTSL